nr:DNA polymerase alpha subunit B-like [Ciona intestinalis]|eukprot:XP_018671885.1 DNA polymerase alpha subunit B-like [Ciona intestinalis]
MAATIDEIKESFLEFDVEINDDEILEKFLFLSTLFGMDAESLTNEWIAFQSRNNHCDVTIHQLTLLEREITNVRAKTRKSVKLETPVKQEIKMEYCDVIKNDSLNNNDSLLEEKVKPSQIYSSRTNSGEVVDCFCSGESPGEGVWRGGRGRVKVTWEGRKKGKYMFQRMQESCDVNNDHIEIGGSLIMEENKEIESYAPCGGNSQTPVVIMGRVRSEDGAKLTPHSVALEGDRGVSSGRVGVVGVEGLTEFSLFPGKLVAMRGVNIDGRKFHVSKIFNLPRRVGRMRVGDGSKEDHFTIMVASGPFTTSDSDDHKPLLDFLDVVTKMQPSLTIFIGPLVEKATSGKTYADSAKFWTSHIINTISDITEVVFVPSQRDLFHHPVYPQPPYNIPGSTKVHFVSNPATIIVNDKIKIGVSSTDILFHLVATEISRSATKKSDRIGRLVSHILNQGSFYPLYPPDKSVNLDLLSSEDHGRIPPDVDLVLLPSNLQHFIKDVAGHICINPGRIVKGKSGGTYARILVDEDRSCVAEIIKI